MRIYISSRDSKHLYPGNTASNFRVQLPQHLEGSWECGVVYYSIPVRPDNPLYLTCDFIDASIMGGRFHPVLCMIHAKNKEIQHINYIRVKSNNISSFGVQVVNVQEETVSFAKGETLIVLDFRPV